MFNKILAAVDGSEPSLNALAVAADLAQQQRAELTIVTVVPLVPPLVMEDMSQAYMPEYQARLRRSHQELLSKTVNDLKESHPGLKTSTALMEGSPARKIIEAAAEHGADLIVLGNRGAGGVATWLLGSVSRQVTDSCTAPVLVVKDRRYCESR
jgi:nucleotide-binding universal stress UspA family protein